MGQVLSCFGVASKDTEPKREEQVVQLAPLETEEELGECYSTTRKSDMDSSSYGIDSYANDSEFMDIEEQPSDSTSLHQRKFYEQVIQTIEFVLPVGYDSAAIYLGRGSYGNVVRTDAICMDGCKRNLAIKKMKDPFLDAFQARRIYREIKLLKLMRHENILRAVDLYTPDRSIEDFKDVYVVTEFAGNSIQQILKVQEEAGVLIIKADHAEFIVYQILRALKYIHSANIMHRDLKPGNLALSDDSDLTVLDFGLARSLERQEIGLTQYVMTRWYRSPEVIYWNIDSYNTQADIWSVGCIAVELCTGRPLFTGDDASTQYDMITRFVGSPEQDLLDKIEEKNGKSMRMVIESYEKHPRVDFYKYFAGLSEKFIDFIDKILVLDPEKRLTVDQALAHPYMSVYHRPSDEPTADWTLQNDVEHSLEEWKEIIWDEIANFQRDSLCPKPIYEGSN